MSIEAPAPYDMGDLTPAAISASLAVYDHIHEAIIDFTGAAGGHVRTLDKWDPSQAQGLSPAQLMKRRDPFWTHPQVQEELMGIMEVESMAPGWAANSTAYFRDVPNYSLRFTNYGGAGRRLDVTDLCTDEVVYSWQSPFIAIPNRFDVIAAARAMQYDLLSFGPRTAVSAVPLLNGDWVCLQMPNNPNQYAPRIIHRDGYGRETILWDAERDPKFPQPRRQKLITSSAARSPIAQPQQRTSWDQPWHEPSDRDAGSAVLSHSQIQAFARDEARRMAHEIAVRSDEDRARLGTSSVCLPGNNNLTLVQGSRGEYYIEHPNGYREKVR